ncbi:ATP-binding protein [bacterium]|nr:ATP-binding protein [bacterium]
MSNEENNPVSSGESAPDMGAVFANNMQDDKFKEEFSKVFEWFNQNAIKLEDAYKHLDAQFQKVNIELAQKTLELREASRKSKLFQENLKTLLSSMKPGVIMVDGEFNITVVNPSAEKMLDIKAHEILELSFNQVFSSDSAFQQTMRYAFKNPTEVIEEEKNVVFGDIQFPASFKCSSVLDLDNSVIGVVLTFTDLSAFKRLEGEVQQGRILSALGEMAATVAHEIRNPLGGIGGYAGLLSRDLDKDDPRKRLVKKIIQGVSSLNKIVSNLLYYTRKTQLHTVKIDLVGFIDDVLGYVEIEADKAKVELEICKDYSEGVDWSVSIDPEKFQEVLLNLSLNALQAIESKGRITVILRREEDLVRLSIKDSGGGMSQSVQAQIFNPFYTTKEQGTGLGLAIVKKIVELHGGQIDVVSEVDVGTEFIIELRGQK